MTYSALLILIIVESIYLIVGGFIFWTLESDKEAQHKTNQRNFNLTSVLQGFTDDYPSVSLDNLTCFINRLLELERSDLLMHKESNNWDVHGSLFFAMTVVTTIGYGNVSPQTTGGQLFCCFFAIVGIPLTMVMLLGIGELFQKVVAKVNCKLLAPRFHDSKLIATLSISLFGILLFLLIPAAVFTNLEDWGYGSALYYGVITTTTVGFGDYVAAWTCVGDSCWIYRISVGIWIFLGLAWLAGVISSIQDGLQMIISKAGSRCGRKKSTVEDDCKPEERENNSESTGNDVITSTALRPIATIVIDDEEKL